ncbi:MAG: anti-sigma factor [Chitinophagales bacterium]
MSIEQEHSAARFARIITPILLTISLLANFYFTNQLQQTDKIIAELNGDKQIIKEQYNLLKGDLQRVEDNLEIIRQADNKVSLLKGTAKATNSSALIYWNKTAKTTYIDANSLPVPAGGKQYQVWQIDNDNKYESLGVFNHQTDKDNLFRLKNMEANPKAFAVSLELARGAEQPTMSQIYVKGDF